MRTRLILPVMLALLATCKSPAPQPPPVVSILKPAERAAPPRETATPKPTIRTAEPMRFSATAYSIDGITKSGTRARRGIVAADPKVLPLGSRIRVWGAGRYSGVYLVEDTGPAVKGRIIDIKVGSVAEAVKFGRQRVEVQVLRWGYEDAEASAK